MRTGLYAGEKSVDFGPGSCCYGLDTNSSLRIFCVYVCTQYAHRRSRHEKVTRTRSAMQGEKEGKKRRGMIRLCVASDCNMHLPCVVFECLAFFLSIPFNCFLEMSDMQMYIDDSLSYNCS